MSRFYLDTSLGQVHGVRRGAGPSIVLLGSSGRSSRQFRDLVEELSQDFDVLAPDLPGFGMSDPLPVGTTIEAIADMLVEILDGLAIDGVDVFGLHTGNKIGAALAVRHPERVRRLILAGQSHSLVPDNTVRNAGIRHIVEAYVNTGGAGETPAAQRREAAAALLAETTDEAGVHPLLGGLLVDHALDESQAAGTPTLYRANMSYDLEAGFRAIRVPTHVLEIATDAETGHVGLQGPKVVALVAGSTLGTLHMPDIPMPVTLENRAPEIARIIRDFAGDQTA